MRISLLCFFFLSLVSVSEAQKKTISAKEYEQAEKSLGYNTEKLIDAVNIRPNWLGGDKFWYLKYTGNTTSMILVDPEKQSREQAFNMDKLVAAVSKASGKQVQSADLSSPALTLSENGKMVLFRHLGKKWKYDIQADQLSADESPNDMRAAMQARMGRGIGANLVSPDGKYTAFIKDDNLWITELATRKQIQLTTDGIKDYGYATDNAGWTTSDRPVISWSPDSKKIATFRQDQRNVSDMYLVPTNVGKPSLRTWKYPLPGDKEIITIERIIIDVEAKKLVKLQIPPDPHRASLSDDISSSGGFDDVDWNADASQLAFLSTSRDHKIEKFRIADATTGVVREVFEEKVATQYESGWDAINWRYLAKSNEIIWFSERDNWGHLYLYDAATGNLKNQITKGEWVVTKLLHVDEQNRTLYFMAGGREKGNPYFAHFYSIGFDGNNLKLLTPETGNHQITLSPSKNYFIDTYSQPDVPQVAVMRNMRGDLITPLEKADISKLLASGWKPPVPVSLKAADGKTDIYGLVFTPSKMDPAKKYPVIDYIYPGPQGGSVGSWSFSAARSDHQALAELGFIVVVIEGTSNPLRSKSFHDMSYGNMAENTLPDQIASIRQLSLKYPMDTTKVGIWGHSGGGFATATAMFRYPDFFKVGISESGNHDNRNYEDDWGERYNGLVEYSNYEAQANQNYAKNLKGKLLLAHGMMDNNVPPSNTMLVVDALIKANKTFDLIVFPNSAHGYGSFAPYMMRRRWDYFVENLLGAEPPRDYELKASSPRRN